MNLLVEDSAKTRGIQPQPAFLGPDVRVQVKLPCRVPIDVAVETGHPKTRFAAFAIVRGVEFFLRKWGKQKSQTIQLNRSQDVFEETVIIVDGDHLPARNVPQFWPVAQEYAGRKFRQEYF